MTLILSGTDGLSDVYWDEFALAAHEAVHCEQIERDGAVKWTIKILYYLARYGYLKSPYEIEARTKAGY